MYGRQHYHAHASTLTDTSPLHVPLRPPRSPQSGHRQRRRHRGSGSNKLWSPPAAKGREQWFVVPSSCSPRALHVAHCGRAGVHKTHSATPIRSPPMRPLRPHATPPTRSPMLSLCTRPCDLLARAPSGPRPARPGAPPTPTAPQVVASPVVAPKLDFDELVGLLKVGGYSELLDCGIEAKPEGELVLLQKYMTRFFFTFPEVRSSVDFSPTC